MHSRFPALLLVLAPLTPLAGQTAPDRLALDRFHDSLALVTDTSALRAARHALARQRQTGSFAALRSALVTLRLAQLGVDADAGDARGELRRLTEREPGWPWTWHALAAAEICRAAWERSDSLALGNRVGIGTLERALEHERRAVAEDPGFVPAALTLAELALGLRDTALYAGARDALRAADAAQRSPPAELLLARGRLERATDQSDSALQVFARAAAGGAASDPRARAEPVSLRGSSSRAPSWRSGRATGRRPTSMAQPPTTPRWSRRTVRISHPSRTTPTSRAFDAASGAARSAFLHRFWTDRDHAELRQAGERIREHYRRLLYARRHFALTIWRRFYGPADAYRSGSEEIDDRGVVYVRHGEPAVRLKPFVFGLMPNETWRYGRADGDMLFHFSAGYDGSGGGDLYDYRLVESVLDLRGAADAPVDQLLLSRSSLSPLYGRMLNWGPNGAARARGRERGIGRASIEFGTTTDSYELQFARRLIAYANLVAVGRWDGTMLGQFVFALGPRETTPAAKTGGVSYGVRVRLTALDGAGHAVASCDTTVAFELDRALARGQYLIGRVELPLPPGTWEWRAALSQGADAGVVLPRDSVRVGAPGPALALSDLALGIRAASARWFPTPADTVLLTPFNLFLKGSEVELYYEAGGARAGTSYRHEIAVFHVRDDDRVDAHPVVTLRVDETAAAEVIRAHRTLRLDRLKPGRYVVEVKVGGPEGATDTRRREIRVVERER